MSDPAIQEKTEPSTKKRVNVGVRRLSPDNATVFMGAYGLLHCMVKDDTLYRGVFAVRLFPVSYPNRFISLRYTNDEELLADERIEAVVLAMPVQDRTPIAFKALECGKHVLIEKPIAGKAEDVRKMMALQGDRVVACCSPRKFFTGHAQAAAACVASGALGKIRMVRFRAILGASADPNPNPPPWRESMARNGGGILVNWSCGGDSPNLGW